MRRAGVFEQAKAMLHGSRWLDPATLVQGGDAPSAKPGEPVVVYCVYGHEVGRAAALQLRAAGIDARFLVGGIDGWTQAGRPVSDKPR